MLVEYDPHASAMSGEQMPKVVLLRSSEDFPCDPDKPMHETYQFLVNRKDPSHVVKQWEEFLQAKIDVVPIPGNHFEAFKSENVSACRRVARIYLKDVFK